MKKTKLKPVSKKAKMKMLYGEGGSILNQIGEGISMAAPLLGMIPGIGMAAGPIAGLLGGAMGQMGEGGKIKPYVTNDPNDPRIQAYKDSSDKFMNSYNVLQNTKKDIKRDIGAFSYRADKHLSDSEKLAITGLQATHQRYSYKPQYEEKYYDNSELDKDIGNLSSKNKAKILGKSYLRDDSYMEALGERINDQSRYKQGVSKNSPIGYYGIGDFRYENSRRITREDFDNHLKGKVNRDVENYYNETDDNSKHDHRTINIDNILKRRDGFPKNYKGKYSEPFNSYTIPRYAAPKQQVIYNGPKPQIKETITAKTVNKVKPVSRTKSKPVSKPVEQPIVQQVTPEAQTQINTGKEDTTKLAYRTDSTGKRHYRVNGKDVPESVYQGYTKLKHKIVEYGEGGKIHSSTAESTGTKKYINKQLPVGLANFNPLTEVQRSFNKESFKNNPVNAIKEDPEMGQHAAARYEISDSTIYTHPGKLPRNAEDSLSYNLAETPHAKQLKEMGYNGMLGQMVVDYYSYPKSEQYNTPGTIEHDAHSIKGVDMKYDYLGNIMNYNEKTGKLNGRPIDIDKEASRIRIDDGTFVPTKNLTFGKGGSIGGVQINAEQNELIIDPKSNKVKMDLRNLPPHPKDPNMMNPNGTLNLPEDFKNDIVIPKAGHDGREAFLKAKKNNDKPAMNRIKRNLTNKQMIREAAEAADSTDMYKEGGKIYLKQPKRMDDGGYLNRELPYRPELNPAMDFGGATHYDGMGDIYRNAKQGLGLPSLMPNITPQNQTGQLRTTMSNNNNNPGPRGSKWNSRDGGTPGIEDMAGNAVGSALGTGLLNNVGNLYQLGNAIFNQEDTQKVNNTYQNEAYGLMKDRRYNAKPELDANKSSVAGANYALKNSGTQNGSEVRSRLTDVLRSKFTADSRVLANKQNVDNNYIGEQAQMRNQMGEYNRNEDIRVNTANEQNRANRQDMIGSSLSSIGRNSQMQINDQTRIDLLPSLFPGMGNDGNEILKMLLGRQDQDGK